MAQRNKTTYGELFPAASNPFTPFSVYFPETVTPDSMHEYFTAELSETPLLNNAGAVSLQIKMCLIANQRKYLRIQAADILTLSPDGVVSLTTSTTKTGVDTHANAHTGIDSDALTRSGTDSNTTSNNVTDKTTTYDAATLRDVGKSESSGGGSITYGSTHTTTRTHGTTDTLTDTYGTTTTTTADGMRTDPAAELETYLRAIDYSLLKIMARDLVDAISLRIYI